jgi:VanZ family protein
MPPSGIPELSIFSGIPFFDKWVHAGLFFVLSMLLLTGLGKQKLRLPGRFAPVWPVLLLCVLYGMATELFQLFPFTGRQASLYDWIADIAGSTAGAGIYSLWNSIFVK